MNQVKMLLYYVEAPDECLLTYPSASMMALLYTAARPVVHIINESSSLVQ